MDAGQIKDMLAGRAEEVCRILVPHGKLDGYEWVAGDFRGAAGQSFRVCVSGAKVGVFCDFAEEGVKGSNLLELWMLTKSMDFKTAIGEARSFLGVNDEYKRVTAAGMVGKVEGGGSRVGGGKKKNLDGQLHEVKEGSDVWLWLTEERAISPEAVRAYRIGEALIKSPIKDGGTKERTCVVFPFFDPAGNLVRMKFRDIHEKKYMFIHPKMANADQYEHGAPLHLFGIQAVEANKCDGKVCITEGELDAMSMWDFGNPAVSLPIGAQPSARDHAKAHDEWIERDYDWLEGFVTVLLALDGDIPGMAAREILVPRFRRERCMVFDWPEGVKDANEAAMNGLTLIDELMAMRPLDPDELKSPTAFRKEIWERFFPPDGEEPGDKLPFTMPFMFRDDEVTVHHGFNGHGKSVGLTHLMVHLAGQARKCCIASFEIPASMTLQNMMKQAMGRHKPADEAHFDVALDWMDKYIYIYDYVGEALLEPMMETWEYAARKYGVNHFVLDSMLKLKDVVQDQFDTQRQLMNRMNRFAKEYHVHVHLVCHDKKPDSRHPKEKFWGGEYDIKGSGDISDLAWNVICWWRNESKLATIDEKQNEIKASEEPAVISALEEEIRNILYREDATLIVQKQRTNGQYPLHKKLWFDYGDNGCWRFREDRQDPVLSYIRVDE